jgi:hypothetical protein
LTDQDLTDAYIRGSISRRVFVRRLVAAGFSVSTAVAYSDLLTPDWALAAQRSGAPYTHYICYIPDSYTKYRCYGVPSYAQQPPTYIPPLAPPPGPPAPPAQPPPAAPAAPPLPPPVANVALLRSVRVSRLSLATLLLTGRLVLVVNAAGPCHLAVTATLQRIKPHHGHKSVEESRSPTIGSAHATLRKAGSHRINLRLNRSGRTALRSLRSKHVSLTRERIAIALAVTGSGQPTQHTKLDVHLRG